MSSWRSIFAFVALLGLAIPALAGLPPADIGRTVLFAAHSIQIDRDCAVSSGDLVVNAAGAAPFLGELALSLDQGVTTPAGYALRADSIDLDRGAIAGGDAVYNTLRNDGTIQGAKVTPLSLPVISPVPAMLAPGADPSLGDFSVAKNATASIAPGVYGALNVADGAVLTFVGSNYTFASIVTGRGAQLIFDNANVVVTGNMSLGAESSAGSIARGGASGIVLYVYGSSVAIGRTCSVGVNIVALDAMLSFDRDCRAEGSFLARNIRVATGGHVALASAFSNQPPVADAINAFTDGAAPLPITLTGSDPEGAALTFSIVTAPSQGTLSPLDGSAVTYTPFTAGNVLDSFTFKVTDPHGASATAAVTINPVVSDPNPTGSTVTANAGSGSVVENQFATFRISGDAPPATSLTFTVTRQPSHGAITDVLQEGDDIQRGAQVTYLPALGFAGDDLFEFQACGSVNGQTVCASATFTIHVTPGDNNGR